MAQSLVTDTIAFMVASRLDRDGDVLDLRSVLVVLNQKVIGGEGVEVRDLGVERDARRGMGARGR